jgi:hypothetical protein
MTWRTAIDLQARQVQVRAALATALAGLNDEVAEQPPAPGTWSIAQTVAHLVATERSVLADLRLMLIQEHPELPSIRRLDDPDLLSGVMREAGGSLDRLVAAFDAACAETLDLVRHLSEEEECRSGHGPELGNLLLSGHPLNNTRYHYPGHIAEIWKIRARLGLAADDQAVPAGLNAGFLA